MRKPSGICVPEDDAYVAMLRCAKHNLISPRLSARGVTYAVILSQIPLN